MMLSKKTIDQITSGKVQIPAATCFDLPEKVLQFGTGVLLRGLTDYFIDKANKQGIFNGRIVVVKSTGNGQTDSFDQQDNLYTLCVRGIESGKKVEENIINASVSRVLSARNNWNEILECAANPEMQIVISNTTEVGIVLSDDNIHSSPPESFPGKLLAFLYRRFTICKGDVSRGMIIIPTELLPDNGKKLLAILLELAKKNNLEEAFINWLQHDNYFCNSLVDRIVPGKLSSEKQKETETLLGYSDELMIMSEVYRLWAIESASEKVKQKLSFCKVDEGVIIAPDIFIYRELKLRLLNGSHTFSCGLAHLAGFTTVKEAMQDDAFFSYIKTLMLQEIAPVITTKDLSMEMATNFAGKVLERYANPYIEHKWLSITLQYSSKMHMRNVPLLQKQFAQSGTIPECMCLGFAAHLLFMKSVKVVEGRYFGEANGMEYPIQDDHAAWYATQWKDPENLVRNILSNQDLWGTDLTTLTGFAERVSEKLHWLMDKGAMTVIHSVKAEMADR